MLYPEIAKLMEGFDSRYSLVVATAKRARQLVCDASNDKTVSRAIKEIADGNKSTQQISKQYGIVPFCNNKIITAFYHCIAH